MKHLFGPSLLKMLDFAQWEPIWHRLLAPGIEVRPSTVYLG
ncbi:MAG: hypothetical protein ACXV2D_03425 [Halobacteriota archaeon]